MNRPRTVHPSPKSRLLRRVSVVAATAAVVLIAGCGASPTPEASAATMPAASGSPAPFHLLEARIADIHAALEAHTLTSTELVKLYLARIKAYNGTCVEQPDGILGVINTIPNAGQINALQTLNLRPAARAEWGFDDRKARSMTDAADADPAMPDALEVAAELDRQFAETGKLVGPLHGIVFAVKDQYDTVDMRSTSGADARYANDRPPDDATFVERLRAAGAIILAKSNLGEYASGIPRSSFGGTFCNPYDTERSPSGSSSGSGSSVGANLVTCAIAEETGSSIRGPARANSSVGIAATEELVSRDGMIQPGINTRVGPICRNVEDVAKVLQVIAGYDPKDELTVFGMGRMPAQRYETFARQKRLDGMRIGVVREYMDKSLFTEMDAETIDIVSRAVEDMKALGADVVDPGAGGALFGECLRRYNPQMHNKIFARQFPDLFPVTKAGAPATDHIATLVAMAQDPSLVPGTLTLRDLGQATATGENRYMMNRYLAERGDAEIKSNADLVAKSSFHQDPQFPDRKLARERQEEAKELDMSDRMMKRFAVQQMVLQCMALQGLDALIYPTSNLPPAKLGAPGEPSVNGRGGSWSMLGQQGFPAITVPAGFTTQVYDRVRDPGAPIRAEGGGGGGEGGATAEGTHVAGPLPAKLPVGMDIVGRPFDEPTLFLIASAYEAATKHRMPPPDFGRLDGEP
jgi:Asp-tRNA(Asn)/Glu-tRNA(Gln) amidotransferase A subunit family amidase